MVEMRQAFQSSACYHSHSHDEFSFGVIDAGVADYRNLSRRHRIIKGDTVTINPGDLHSCNPHIGQWSYRMLFVDTPWIAQLQDELFSGIGMDYLAFAADYSRNPQSYNDFSQLFNALINDNNPLEAESLLVNYLATRFAAPSAEKVDQYGLNRIKQLIGDDLHTNHSLSHLAHECGLSRYHLVRCFKQIYGITPHAYQLDERIKRAKQLLKRGELIANVAQQLGFSDQSHLQRNFKKRLAITPKQYQAFFIAP